MATTVASGSLKPGSLNSKQYKQAVDSKLHRLWPDGKQLAVFLNQLPEEKVYQEQYYWYEIDNRTGESDTLGAEASASDDSITVTTGGYYKPGDCLVIWAEGSNTTEYLRVNGTVSGTTVPVQRAYAGSASIHASGATVLNIGPAFEDGSSMADRGYSKEEEIYNNIEFPRLAFSVTRWTQQQQMLTGQSLTNLRESKLIEWWRQLEMKFILQARSRQTVNGNLLQTSGGLDQNISTNVVVMGTTTGWTGNTTMTETEWEAFLEISMYYGGEKGRKMLIASPFFISVVNRFPSSKLQTAAGGSKYGFKLDMVTTPHGELDIMPHKLLNHYGATNRYDILGSYAYIIDPGNIKKVTFAEGGGFHHDRFDAKTLQGVHETREEFWTDLGWKIMLEKTHSKLTSVTAAA